MSPIPKIIIIALGLLVMGVFVLAIFDSTNYGPWGSKASRSSGPVQSLHDTISIATKNGTFAIPGTAYMDGRELSSPQETEMNIIVWDAVPWSRPVCELQHGTKVEIHEARFHVPGEYYCFRVTHAGCEGWVFGYYLSTSWHEPVGKRIDRHY